jgi:hypothetical protein
MALRRAELRQETSSFDDCAETDLSLNSEVGSEGRREIGYRLELVYCSHRDKSSAVLWV